MPPTMQEVVELSLSMQRRSDEENGALKDELSAERRKGYEQRAKMEALTARCKRAEKLLGRVPREMIEKTEDKKRDRSDR